MEVQVRDSTGKLIWSRNTVGGLTSASYGNNGTLTSILKMLELALHQCKGELAVSDDVDRVCDGRATTTYVDGDVPITCTWCRNSSGEHFVKTPEVLMPPALFES